MIKTIHLIRHGLRVDWDTDEWTSVTRIPNDTPLNVLGAVQAQEIAPYFEAHPISGRLTAIFSSPSYRCLQTIQPTVLDLSIFIDHGLSEWHSTVKTDSTTHPSFPAAVDLRPFVPEIDPAWTSNMSQPMRFGCSSITTFRLRKAENENWEAVRVGSGDHLEKGSLNEWGFEDMDLFS